MRKHRLLMTLLFLGSLVITPAARAAAPPTPWSDVQRILNGARVGHPGSGPSGRVAVAHAYVSRVALGLVAGRHPYGVNEIAIVTQDQQDTVWCVPAATRAVLSAFITRLPTQRYLSLLEGTDWLGTYLDRVPVVLNHYQARISYEYRFVFSVTEYRERVRTDVDMYRAPLIFSVDPRLLPWYRSLGVGAGNHAVVGYGYAFMPRFAGISVWDPSGLPQAGRHIVGVGALWQAGAPMHHPMVA
ncbi:MAG: hypothetical protein WCJ42_05725 [Actinomycetes bacterium]